MNEPNGTLLTAKEVAAKLRVSVSWVLQHAAGNRRPVLPSIKMGHAVRFRGKDIDDFIELCNRAMEQGLPIRGKFERSDWRG